MISSFLPFAQPIHQRFRPFLRLFTDCHINFDRVSPGSDTWRTRPTDPKPIDILWEVLGPQILHGNISHWHGAVQRISIGIKPITPGYDPNALSVGHDVPDLDKFKSRDRHQRNRHNRHIWTVRQPELLIPNLRKKRKTKKTIRKHP